MSDHHLPSAPAADAPQADQISFAELGLDERLLGVLRDAGYESPTPIQSATIPVLLGGKDVVGIAQTGTGKTAAFALPILSRLDVEQRTPQALVLAPTRELALQVCEAFEKYATHLPGVHVLPVYGGQGYGVQLSALRRGVHILVGTPGRIIDHLEKGTLDLSGVRFLVLDEADEMLTMGFAEEVETILAQTPESKQVALFCATMPGQIRRLADRYLHKPTEITIQGRTTTAPNIRQRYVMVAFPQKVDALTRILEVEDFDAMIVFVRTKNDTETLAEKLRARGFSAMAINGDLVQSQRERTIGQLKSGALDILVATDVAARGLDVDRVSHVVNFDIPTDTESYVHRIGRTGRAGRSGEAISFVTPRERHLLRAIEQATRQTLTLMKLPTVEDINATRLSRFDDAITEALGHASLDFFRDVIGHYVQEYDVPEADVAAALAVVLQGDEPMLLEAEPEPPVRAFEDRDRRRGDRDERGDRADRGEREGAGDRGSRPERRERRERGAPLATYRIAVGKRHNIGPRQIVGALAHQGGLQGDDFGHIDIRQDFSLVELPAELPPAVWDALASTRIAGRYIDLRPDRPKGDGWKPRGEGHKGDKRDRQGRTGFGFDAGKDDSGKGNRGKDDDRRESRFGGPKDASKEKFPKGEGHPKKSHHKDRW